LFQPNVFVRQNHQFLQDKVNPKTVYMLPWVKHAFRPGRRFHEIIRKWVSNGQSIQTGRHYLQDNIFFKKKKNAIFKETKALKCNLTTIQR
jgi:hypothetical protein